MKSAKTIGVTLPDDIVADILSRLRVKSLVRFRYVCKSWCSVMTTPCFINTHLNRSPNQFLILRSWSNLKPKLPPLLWEIAAVDTVAYVEQAKFQNSNQLDCSEMNIVGTCNGIVCLQGYIVHATDKHRYSLYLWNPVLRKLKTLHHLFGTTPFPFCAYGFGFHIQTNDYKVVRIKYADIPLTALLEAVEVYSLRMDSWKNIEALPPCIIDYHKPGVFVNGSHHWLGYRKESGSRSHFLRAIVSFDIGDEVFREIMLPAVCLLHRDASPFAYKDSLAVYLHVGHGDDEYAKGTHYLWVMMEYGVPESWTNLFRIDLTVTFCDWCLGITDNGEFLMMTRDKDKGEEEECYVCAVKASNDEDSPIKIAEAGKHVTKFRESLVSLEGKNPFGEGKKAT